MAENRSVYVTLILILNDGTKLHSCTGSSFKFKESGDDGSDI